MPVSLTARLKTARPQKRFRRCRCGGPAFFPLGKLVVQEPDLFSEQGFADVRARPALEVGLPVGVPLREAERFAVIALGVGGRLESAARATSAGADGRRVFSPGPPSSIAS